MISFYHGDKVVRDLVVRTSGGGTFNLFGSVVLFTVKRDPMDGDALAVIQHRSNGLDPAILITDEVNGEAVHTITPVESEALVPGYSYFYDYRLIDSLGDPYTIEVGELRVDDNATREVTP